MVSYFGNLFVKLNPFAILIIAAILGILGASLVINAILHKRYKVLQWDLEDDNNRKQAIFESKVLNSIVDDYKMAASLNKEINTQAIIEKHFNNQLSFLYLCERFVKWSVSLMIVLGLLGTFFGLTLSVGRLVELLSSSGNTDVLESMDSVVGGLINSVKGMSVAFITSLFGIASSIILTVVNIIFNVEQKREAVMIEIEEYLDNVLSNSIDKGEIKSDSLQGVQMAFSVEEFTTKLENAIKEITDVLSYRFASATGNIEEFSSSLLKSVEKFDDSLKTFAENTRDFSEFNYHLKNNIQRMSICFDDFTEDLKKNINNMSNISSQVERLSKSIDNLTEKIDRL
ncbi:MotA/TolQ/ExbB proton channel family protein [Caminicella sporogenes DSM 14501]|uniref:MotA/TolQ/ExbB proton channel family protein n=1 Tax=Caminicella sporogenes DSM 14501 TaxID=1121266 RepID=A0A1M6SM94_9FIRM|nr:MotA/TolQ/ExbB proton channel family protein [Caminicella sporogenes]RKD26545.1 hypothetical protein BET04_10480 [Caminicella sporogenes]SHK45904.1 MotA/TolQ/ExbB proton channel family protein [Caminicella sporogenes DSM 14501]